ncbi:MAG: hybrid sensor histidine kinase/response regulator [Spirulinaceae cyanobacterium SM2_1_0]|nr:hybrid sensor histidine kinase/response regulator [Spirulinaceae cyanobacterium SM2_1_0]
MSSPQQPTLLIVDDNPTNIKVLFGFLRDAGFRVLVAKDGGNALEKLQETLPDLILLDVMMPGIDGFETCRRLKQDETTRAIPVIFMTALAEAEHKVKGLALGAVDYITKPFQQEEVLARIDLHLKLRSLAAELADKNEQLSDINTVLEEKVAARTQELQDMQAQMVLTEKMSSLGQLVAGVAHEINNPVGFISGNIEHARGYLGDLKGLIEMYRTCYPEPAPEIVEEIEAIELDYLLDDFPKLLESLHEGSQRIAQISRSMRTFSRADTDHQVEFDLHEGIDSTLMILKHRLKANEQRPAIAISKEYGNLPAVQCYPGQLNQVFMNLLANAIDALDEGSAGRSFADLTANPNRIHVQTRLSDDRTQVIVRIADNGAGMPPEVQKRVFENSFTTKAVGKGTGLGLAIARQIVVERHGGQLEFTSELGQGTEFAIHLPLTI